MYLSELKLPAVNGNQDVMTIQGAAMLAPAQVSITSVPAPDSPVSRSISTLPTPGGYVTTVSPAPVFARAPIVQIVDAAPDNKKYWYLIAGALVFLIMMAKG